MNSNLRFDELLEKYLVNTASAEEWTTLMEMIRGGDFDNILKQRIDDVLAQRDGHLNISPDRAHDLLYKILSVEKHTAKLLPLKTPVRKLWTVAAAAVIIIALSFGTYFILQQAQGDKSPKQTATYKPPNADIPPGGNKAMLILADGTTINLDDVKNGNIAQQGNTNIIKIDGKLSYNASGATEAVYNTITTPKTGQYQLVLPDGTKVWLDASSSFTFPTSFTGKERNVELTGQVYFEVAYLTQSLSKGGESEKAMPFIATVNGMKVKVLGTHFNIMAYDDETAIKTTLLEGSVKVMPPAPIGEKSGVVIKPGQQAQLKNGELKVVKADVEQAVAWKNGLFNFKSEDLSSVMNQIARWYDVEIVYEGKQNIHLSGYINRNINLNEALKLLETNGVHFRREDKKIIMLP